MIDLSKLTDASGKPIDTSKADPAVMAVLSAAFGSLSKAVTEAVTKVVSDTTKPLAEKITATEAKIAEVKAGALKPDNKDDEKGDAKPDEIPAWAKELKSGVDELKATVTGQQREKQVHELANAWLDKHRPGLKPEQRKAVLAAIVSANPDSEEKVEAVFKAKQAEYAAIFGAENAEKAFSANVAAEGGEAAKAQQEAAAEKAKLDGIAHTLEAARK